MKPIKSITILLLSLLLSAGIANSQTTTTSTYDLNLEWDPSPVSEGVTGYKIYQKVTSGTPAVITWRALGVISVPSTRFKVTGLAAGTATFAVTAFNANGESERSNELTNLYLTPPKNLRVVLTLTVGP